MNKECMTTFVIASLLCFAAMGSSSAQTALTFISQGDFCDVEIRAGNSGNATSNPVVYRGHMTNGQSFSYTAVLLFAQREANPGHCPSGRGYWQQCSFDPCNIN